VITDAPAVRTATRPTPLLAARDVIGVARRNLLRTMRTPQLLMFAIIQPVLLLVLLRYIFAGAVRMPVANYVDFVVPAIFIEAVLVGAMTSAIGIAEDLKSGMIDRLRSLPMARSAVLAGRSLTDLVRSTIALAVMIGIGTAVGFRFHSDAGRIVLGVVVVLAFGYALCWMNASIGIMTKDPESATNAGTLPTFVFLFASNAIVPTVDLPSWLQAFARNQPLSVAATAVRLLFEGGAAGHFVWLSLAWSAGIAAVCFAVAYGLYERAAVG
jgi:ABC transporter DrrB family efflux protein